VARAQSLARPRARLRPLQRDGPGSGDAGRDGERHHPAAASERPVARPRART
jgi:hypothetical protein